MKINGKPDGGGGGGVITGLSVSANGTYIATGGVDGYSPVNVSVPEQKPEETFSVTPSITEQTITPQEGYVFSGGTVASVTSTIDANIQAGNIKSGVTILGVEGNYTAPAPVTSELSVSINGTYTPGQGVDGFSKVTVDVPQSVAGFTEKEITEETYAIYNLNNSAAFVHRNVFEDDDNLLTVNLPNASYVGSEAFRMCDGLTSVDLPACTLIWGSAFMSCKSLTYISAPKLFEATSDAFNYCIKLSSVDFPSLTYTGPQMFMSCYSLQNVSLPECVFIATSTFKFCSQLVSIELPRVEVFNTACFEGCKSLYELSAPTVYSLSSYVFNNCTSLHSIDLPFCVSVGTYAFNACNTLSQVNLPFCIRIFDNAFSNCSIQSISAPLVTQIAQNAFYVNSYNVSLSVLDFPMCSWVGSNAFSKLSSITTINMPVLERSFNLPNPGIVTDMSIGNKTYYIPYYDNWASNVNSIYVDAAMYDKWVAHSQWGSLSAAFVQEGNANEPMLSYSDGVLTGKTWCILPYFVSYLTAGVNYSSITSVDLSQCRYVADAFPGFSKITTVNLPECKVLGQSAFKNCYSITTVSLPKCEYIDSNTFNEDYRISSIVLPECRYIGQNAFYSCGSLSYVELPKCEYIDNGAFSRCNSLSYVDLPKCRVINSDAFNRSPLSFLTIVLRYDGIVHRNGTFNNVDYVSIYVPSNLVDQYKVNPFWSDYSSRIFPIPE